jgi:hypothetical protein
MLVAMGSGTPPPNAAPPNAAPPAVAPLLDRLRAPGVARPAVDPELAGGLREWLEDALAEPVAGLAPEVGDVRVRKDALTQVLLCEAHFAASRAAPRRVTVALARGSLVDALFRQWVTVGDVGDPLSDALSALQADDGGDGVVGFVAQLPTERRRALAGDLAAHLDRIRGDWPVPSPSWLLRTQDRVVVPLAGGRVVLSGVVDLAFGGPALDQASVCLVEVKSGGRRVEHRADLHFYALLETLRSGAPPFRVATYYTATGELDAEPIGEDVLVGALGRVVAATTRMCRLAAGDEPTPSPNPLCAWCAGLPGCAPGQERAGTDVPRSAGDDAELAGVVS